MKSKLRFLIAITIFLLAIPSMAEKYICTPDGESSFGGKNIEKLEVEYYSGEGIYTTTLDLVLHTSQGKKQYCGKFIKNETATNEEIFFFTKSHSEVSVDITVFIDPLISKQSMTYLFFLTRNVNDVGDNIKQRFSCEAEQLIR